MRHSFSAIPRVKIERSVFDRSHSYKTTFQEGQLIPIYVEEVLPGDSFKLDANIFARLASPLKTPIMDDMTFDLHFFFVPNRLLWSNWERMNGQQDSPSDSTDYMVPIIDLSLVSKTATFAQGSVADYFGLPTGVPSLKVSALPFRAYVLVYNEWYRDQNLIGSLPQYMGDGGSETLPFFRNSDGAPEDFSESAFWCNSQGAPIPLGLGEGCLRRCKRHDYFTSCLPWPQKGPGVELPLGGVAPVGVYEAFGPVTNPTPSNLGARVMPWLTAAKEVNTNSVVFYGADASGAEQKIQKTDTDGAYAWQSDQSMALATDLSQATAATINSLRQAFQLQRLYERDARGGTRYTEILRAHFGVVSPDARLQRPEYLGGISQPVIINPIAQTSSSTENSALADLAAFGVVGASRRGFSKSFVEHGWILGIASVRSNLTYQQGIPRMFSRRTRFDFYWPVLAHLGEQAVLNKEIYAQGTDDDDKVFGYQERWAEYRYHPSMITGKMRSTDAQSLDIWHLAQEFQKLPALNREFIQENAPLDRCVAVPLEPHFLLDCYFRVKAARPMPVYSVPGLVDHF